MSFRITPGLLGVQKDEQSSARKRAGRINDEVLREVEHDLDLSETRLSLM